MYLVDTNVISASAPTKAVNFAELVKWMDEHSTKLYLSVVTVAEIEDGIAQAHRKRARRKAADLTAWLDALLHLYVERILAFDIAAARVAGQLSDVARSKGLAPGFADIVIGATACAHQLTILTRNVRHFMPLGISSIDPFDELPA